jgi:pimeloyl-ACP methyl ester carboxylesterase
MATPPVLDGTPSGDGLAPWIPDPGRSPAADPALAPEGFVVLADDGVRLHFHDWGGPPDAAPVLHLPGALQPAWSWAPVARRLAAVRRVVVADLRGHCLSDAPVDGYDLDTLASDSLTVAEGAGLTGGAPLAIAGHGFGAIVGVAAAARLGTQCAGLVLVDGGWERLETTTRLDVGRFLRGLDEPREVMRSIGDYLGDRRAFDPPTWDADQERAALDSVVETAAGHVVRAVRPSVIEAVVRTMFEYDPAVILPAVEAPVAVLVAAGAGDVEVRLDELRRTAEARLAAGRAPIRVATFPEAHNLMRYRPAEVAETILAAQG